jgi:hypothetical protein
LAQCKPAIIAGPRTQSPVMLADTFLNASGTPFAIPERTADAATRGPEESWLRGIPVVSVLPCSESRPETTFHFTWRFLCHSSGSPRSVH